MHVDPNDPNTVLWLQQALPRVIPWRIRIDPNGQYDVPTTKAVGIYQRMSNLPDTGEADDVTTAKIEHEIAVLDTQSFKKKQYDDPPFGNPGEPVT